MTAALAAALAVALTGPAPAAIIGGDAAKKRATKHSKPKGPCTKRGTKGNDTLVGEGRREVLCGRGGDDTLIGKGGRDVLIGGGGTDTLYGDGGDDKLRGGRGTDGLHGGDGDDLLLGGSHADALSGHRGVDTLYGRAGADQLFGDSGSDKLDGGSGNDDRLSGGRGNDRLYGGDGARDRGEGHLGDDSVRGGAGDRDVSIGGLGLDFVSGDSGNRDLVRGDLHNDLMDGGPGSHDIASFASATRAYHPVLPRDGVLVNLAPGNATGDAGVDRLVGIEDVEGSPFDDEIHGNTSPNLLFGGPGDDLLDGGGPDVPPGDTAWGGSGTNSCVNAEQVASCDPESDVPGTRVELYYGLSGEATLAISGESGDSAIRIARAASRRYRIEDAMGGTVVPKGYCEAANPSVATCAGEPSLIVAFGDGGADGINISGTPATVDVIASGGPGTDIVVGWHSDDILQAGDWVGSSLDLIYGRGGVDGLIGDGGGDRLNGEGEDDLLVTRWPCDGGVFIGGPGLDNASFADTVGGPLHATLGGTATLPRISGCGRVRLDVSIEDLEGTHNSDILVGNSGPNDFFGQAGNDTIIGGGGRDYLVGSGGVDGLYGGHGSDVVHGRDGRADRELHCGKGRDLAPIRDRSDPGGHSCRGDDLRREARKRRAIRKKRLAAQRRAERRAE